MIRITKSDLKSFNRIKEINHKKNKLNKKWKITLFKISNKHNKKKDSFQKKIKQLYFHHRFLAKAWKQIQKKELESC
jgi:hypothetical protein